jgi:diacylglycerol kinase (ATP)
VPPADVPALTEHAGHLGLPGVAYGRGRRVVVERTDGAPLCFEHDGELQPPDLRRITLDVRPGVLPCWAPTHPEPEPAGAYGAVAGAPQR